MHFKKLDFYTKETMSYTVRGGELGHLCIPMQGTWEVAGDGWK